MKTLTLTAKDLPAVGVEVEQIIPETIAGKALKDVLAITVYAGCKQMKLGDVFEVNGETAKKPENQRIIFAKSTAKIKRIGEKMGAGEVSVEGDAGYHLGEYMSGGKISVSGNASSWIGTGMSGGQICVSGNAGAYVGASSRGLNEGMRGGRIIVAGNVGTEVGVGLAGGEIVVEGVVEDFLGSYMRDGRITVGGVAGRVGYAMSGGEIVVGRLRSAPLYFTKTSEGEDYINYEGDVSFAGKGVLKIRK